MKGLSIKEPVHVTVQMVTVEIHAEVSKLQDGIVVQNN